MFDLSLRARTTRAGALVFSVPRLARLAFAVIALTVAGSAAVTGTLGGVGAAVLLFAAAAACYEERWTFDPVSRTVRFRFGLIFLARTRSLPFEGLESVAVETFVKGKNPAAADRPADPSEEEAPVGLAAFGSRIFRQKRYASLAIYAKDAGRLVVETLSAARADRLEAAAEEISRLSGVAGR